MAIFVFHLKTFMGLLRRLYTTRNYKMKIETAIIPDCVWN